MNDGEKVNLTMVELYKIGPEKKPLSRHLKLIFVCGGLLNSFKNFH